MRNIVWGLGNRLLSGALAVVLAFGMTPAAAYAKTAEEPSADGSAPSIGEGALLFDEVGEAVRVKAIDAQEDSFVADEIIVTYRGEADVATSAADANGAGASGPGVPIEEPVATIPDAEGELIADGGADGDAALVARVEVPEGMSVGEAVVAAEADPSVLSAQPNYRYVPLSDGRVTAAPLAEGRLSSRAVAVNDEYAQNADNDADTPNQWWLNAVRAPEAWEYAKCGETAGQGKVTVAVLDTGINFEHPDLKNNIDTANAWDATTGEKLTKSPTVSALSHGSHVAGIVAAEANNEIGIAGASYNANILPIAVFTLSGGQAGADDATLIRAYNYLMSDPDGAGSSIAERTNTRVVNMSLGGYAGVDEAFETVIENAQAKGMLTVAAGGNGDSQGNPLTDRSYPSDYEEVMSVVALKSPIERTYWSDYNDAKDIAAPGGDIWSTWYTSNDKEKGDYHCTSGTSMAAPLVAGCAALLWAYDSDLTVQQVKDAIYGTAVDLGEDGFDEKYGWGRIDVAAAIESLGRAHIVSDRSVMGQTGTQQLGVKTVREADAKEGRAWNWSVEKQKPEKAGETVVTVSADGLLTAVSPGTAVVKVVAGDDADIEGRLAVTVTPITVPGSVSAVSDGVKHRVTLTWRAADAAVKYVVQRRVGASGPFEDYATVAASDGKKMYGYTDDNADAATYYHYRILPMGSLNGDDVAGEPTGEVRGYFTDKAALSAAMATADELLAGSVASADGRDVASGGKWTTPAERSALERQRAVSQKVFNSQFTRQVVVNMAARLLVEANAAFEQSLAPGLMGRGATGREAASFAAQSEPGAVTPSGADVHGPLAAATLAASDVWDGAVDTSWYAGHSTESSFELTTPAQLAGLAAIVNGTAVVNGTKVKIAQDDFAGKAVTLGADIVLNAVSASGRDDAQELWTPIGSRPVTGTHTGKNGEQPLFEVTNYFKGTFDGRGHVVKNIYACTDAVDNEYAVSDYGGYQGLFGALGEGAVVKNVGVEGGYVSGRVAGGIASLGAPAGTASAPMILNCRNSATVAGDGSSSRGSGGIFGGEQGSESDSGVAFIANCYNTGEVTGKAGNAAAPLGGIAGRGSVRVYSCFNTGAVASSAGACRGNVVGSLQAGGTVADSFGLLGRADALYFDKDDGAVDGGQVAAGAFAALVSEGKLSAAFEAGIAMPQLFWEGGWAEPRDLSAAAGIAAVEPQGFTGKAVEPSLDVTLDGAALKCGSDYYVTYADNVEAGTASYTATFIGAYAGSMSGTFTITSATLDTATVSGLGPQWIYWNAAGDGYDPVVPDIVVKDALGNILEQGKDFDVAFAGVDEPGTGHATIAPHANSSYVGSLEKDFPVVAASKELAAGEGGEAGMLLIGSRADLQLFAHSVNTQPAGGDGYSSYDVLEGSYKLTADIDMTGDEANPGIDAIGAMVGSFEDGYRTKAFAGTFDGGGHKLTMNGKFKGGFFALFPTNADGTSLTVKDLMVEGAVETSASACAIMPSVYGNLTLDNVTTAMNITAGYKAYGLIGDVWPRGNSVKLVGCRNEGSVTGAREASGLVGTLNANTSSECAFTMEGCENAATASVTAGEGGAGTTGLRASGLLGQVNQYSGSAETVRIERCANRGAVASDGTAGGLIASIGNVNGGLGSSARPVHAVRASFNAGSVTAGKNAGGLVGTLFDNNGVDFSNVYNTGAVTSGDIAGGLVAGSKTGCAWRVNVASAYSTGSVKGADGYAGAVMGFAAAGSYYKPNGGELALSNVHYLSGSAADAVGTVQGDLKMVYFTYPGAKVSGAAEARSASALSKTGAGGMAATLGANFIDDEGEANGGYPLLYWQGTDAPALSIASALVGAVPDVEYTGSPITPQVTLKLGGVELKQGADFSVDVEGDATSVANGVKVKVSGIGRYQGEKTATFNIVKADLARFTIDAISPQWGSGADPAKPAFTLRDRSGSPVAVKDEGAADFSVSYAGNTGEDEEASVVVQADDENPCYTGSKGAEFVVWSLAGVTLPGSGTQEAPYEIGSYKQLEYFAKRVDAKVEGYAESHAKLVADVSIPSNVRLDSVGEGTDNFNGGAPFKGVFDGDGHAITMNYRTPTTYSVFNGLQGATVRNLAVRGTIVTTSDASGARVDAGGTFAGVIDASATFENCVNEATVVGTTKAVGGFAAQTDDSGIPAVNWQAGSGEVKFVNCVNKGAVRGSADDGSAVDYVGGFVGYAYTKGYDGEIVLSFENCVNRGPVTSEAGSSVGGILGGGYYDYNSQDSYDALVVAMDGVGNEAPVTAFDGAGGLVGILSSMDELTIENAYNTGDVTISNPDSATGEIAGGLVALAQSGSYSEPKPKLSVRNAYNAGAVACTAAGDAVEPLLGGIVGGLSYDASDSSFDNVYYSLDHAADGIALDQSEGAWEGSLCVEFDDTMRDAGFVEALGDAFVADSGENKGFPVVGATIADLSSYYVYFQDARKEADPTALTVQWTGRATEPAVVVTPSEPSAADRLLGIVRSLAEGEDYVVAYRDNVNAGTATVTVMGVGSYRGSIEATFAIQGAGDLSDCVAAPIEDQVFTGSAIEPDVALTGLKGGSSYTLVAGRDYTTTYVGNVKCGTAIAFVKGVGAWSGEKTVRFRIWQPFITVRYYGADDAEAVVRHYTQAQFEALEAKGADPVSALYFADGVNGSWKVSTAKSYVTLAGLLADAGVPWESGMVAAWAASDDPSKASAYAYDDLYSRSFYPNFEAENPDFTSVRPAPPVLAIEEKSSLIGENQTSTAADAERYNVDNASTANEPRIITGITKAEGLDRTARGSRLVSGVRSITVKRENPISAAAVKAMQTLTYSPSKAQGIAAREAIAVSNAKGAVTYSKLSGNAGITVAPSGDVTVTKGLAAGSYPVRVRVSAAGTAGFVAGSAEVGFVVRIGEAANPMTARAVKATHALTFNASKAQTIAAGNVVATNNAVGTVTYSKASGNKGITVASNGSVTVAKGLAAGAYPVQLKATAAGAGSYASGTATVSFTVKVGKAANPMVVTGKSLKIARGKSVAASKAFKVRKAQGKVTYARVAKRSSPYLALSKSGVVSVKKGAPRGKTLKLKATVKAAGKGSYAAGKKTVVVKVRVK